MCGLIGIVDTQQSVLPALYEGLLMLQHRGQDACGMATLHQGRFRLKTSLGLVSDAFDSEDSARLPGQIGIAHVRYKTSGDAQAPNQAQPFYVNAPFGIVLAHNGNLTNAEALRHQLLGRRHLNTDSDSEVLLNLFADALDHAAAPNQQLDEDSVFTAVASLYQHCQGAFSSVAVIQGAGLLAFRDRHGIRPLSLGISSQRVVVASESVALDALGVQLIGEIAAGEAVLIRPDGTILRRQMVAPDLRPCIFEYVYLARPDSVMNGASIYESRLFMGEALAERVRASGLDQLVDMVIPVPDTSRPSAMQLAFHLNKPYREGFVRNRYVGRTFIMSQAPERKSSVRRKLNPVAHEFRGRNVLLVDDSIVRGTTSREIITMARAAGANKVYLASAAPPVCHPNLYGIDIPHAADLIAARLNHEQLVAEIGADGVVFQQLDELEAAVRRAGVHAQQFESSCFNGLYLHKR